MLSSGIFNVLFSLLFLMYELGVIDMPSNNERYVRIVCMILCRVLFDG